MGCPSLLPSYTGQPSVESLFVSNLMHLSINPANCMMNMPLKFDINVETKVNLQFRQYMSLRPLIFFLINNLSSYLVLKEATFLVTSSTISSGFTGFLPENTVNMVT